MVADVLTRTRIDKSRSQAFVWIDHDRAVIDVYGPGPRGIVRVDRLPAEGRERFESRTISAIGEHDRLVVSGPAVARTEFERAYVALTQRPDCLVDLEVTEPTAGSLRHTA
jgi:hypothetical protein